MLNRIVDGTLFGLYLEYKDEKYLSATCSILKSAYAFDKSAIDIVESTLNLFVSSAWNVGYARILPTEMIFGSYVFIAKCNDEVAEAHKTAVSGIAVPPEKKIVT